MDEEKMKPFHVETTIDAPREAVWRAMTTPAVIREWFGWDYDGLEGEIQFIFVDHSERRPPDRIVGRFQELQLEADGPRTVVRAVSAVRAVLPGSLDEAGWEDIFDGIEEGWRTFFEQMRFMFARNGSGRRTVYLSGTATPAEAIDLAHSLGGQEVWHRSRCQLMLTTPEEHLVGVLAQSSLDSDAAGPISVQVTTYGLDDGAYAAVRDRWAARWTALAKDPAVTP